MRIDTTKFGSMSLRQIIFTTRFVITGFLLLVLTKIEAQDAKSFYLQGEKIFKARQLKSARYDSAIVFYTKAIESDNRFTEAYISRAFCFIELKKFNAAIEDFSKAISLAPDSADYYAHRGKLYLEQGRHDLAINDYTMAIKLTRANDTEGALINYNGRYTAWFLTNQIDSALNDIDTIIRLQPNFYGNYNNRALCYNSLGQYENAVEDYIRYLSKVKNQGNAYVNIISPLCRMNKYKDAIFYLRELRRRKLESFLDDKKYEFYNHFIEAVSYVANKDYEDALLSLDTAALKYGTDIKNETRRGYMDIQCLRGYILQTLGQYDAAITEYEQTLAIDKRQPDATDALHALQSKFFITRSATDKTLPILKRAFDTDTIFNYQPDSIKIRLKGTAFDSSGIQTIRVNKTEIRFSSEGYLGFFEYDLIKKNTDSTDITVTVIDSANLEHTYRKSIHDTRGTVVTVTEESPCVKMGNYYAILIAEQEYTAGWRKLNNPVQDANKLKNILMSKYTFDEANIDTLYNRSRIDILSTIINRCKLLGPDDNLLIFYAGHGDTTLDREGNPEGYLVPVEAPQNKEWFYINSGEIQSALRKSNARHILILLDACYGGAFTRGDKDPEKNTVDLCNQYMLPSRKVMASGSSNQEVPDKSFFMKILANSLENATTDISTQDIWIDVYKKMPKTGFDGVVTTPQYSDIKNVGDDGGSFIFKLRKK